MLENHQIELLKTLSNLVGVSGHEEKILQFVSEQLPFCMKEQDKLGSGLFSLGEGDLSIMFALIWMKWDLLFLRLMREDMYRFNLSEICGRIRYYNN